MRKLLDLGVKTDEGYIPFKNWRGIKLGVSVKKIPSTNKHKSDMIVPERDEEGKFIYVLPGGRKISIE